MIKIIKGNQIVIIIIAIMLVTVGYLNYNIDEGNSLQTIAEASDNGKTEGIGDAKLVSSTALENSEYTYTQALVENDESNNQIENKVENDKYEATLTNSEESKDYFTNSKLERETMYSQMLETYKNMLENPSVTTEQKAIATKEITNITNTKNAIMIAENLIQNKGFKNVVIFVNNGSVNVVVNSDKLSTEQVSQIQNIISRELEAEISNIHISNK